MVEPSTALGNWYATAILWKPQVALFVNERTLLPVFVPLAAAAGLAGRFPEQLGRVLEGLGTPLEFVLPELGAIGEASYAKTAVTGDKDLLEWPVPSRNCRIEIGTDPTYSLFDGGPVSPDQFGEPDHGRIPEHRDFERSSIGAGSMKSDTRRSNMGQIVAQPRPPCFSPASASSARAQTAPSSEHRLPPLHPPATEQDLVDAEQALGQTLPEEVRELSRERWRSARTANRLLTEATSRDRTGPVTTKRPQADWLTGAHGTARDGSRRTGRG